MTSTTDLRRRTVWVMGWRHHSLAWPRATKRRCPRWWIFLISKSRRRPTRRAMKTKGANLSATDSMTLPTKAESLWQALKKAMSSRIMRSLLLILGSHITCEYKRCSKLHRGRMIPWHRRVRIFGRPCRPRCLFIGWARGSTNGQHRRARRATRCPRPSRVPCQRTICWLSRSQLLWKKRRLQRMMRRPQALRGKVRTRKIRRERRRRMCRYSSHTTKQVCLGTSRSTQGPS
mmetsp:Transcript_7246/g.21395  ORF Transcript_7246/g.21395 Transcript_7246/m.21395 type:complete len:232 (-) Transcript_7246:16194-16889(-)